jgi:integrase/recombinase XerC
MNEIILQSDINIEKAKKMFDNLDVAESTRKDYKDRIHVFVKFIEEEGLDVNTYLNFKRKLANKRDYSVSSKNKYLIVARVFLKELRRVQILPVDITSNVKSFKQDKKHKKEGLTENEVNRLVEMLNSFEENPKNTRIKAMIALLILQGLRSIEILRLDVKDIDLANKFAFIRGKGMQDKELIHLHYETVKAIKKYLRTNKISDGPLFVSNSNNAQNQRLNIRGFRKIIKKVFKEAGIEGKSPHSCRHFFITQLIKNYQGDILEVARWSRHRSLEMLVVYDDSIKMKRDLPRYYNTFKNIKF